jgi:hypothetical protein
LGAGSLLTDCVIGALGGLFTAGLVYDLRDVLDSDVELLAPIAAQVLGVVAGVYAGLGLTHLAQWKVEGIDIVALIPGALVSIVVSGLLDAVLIPLVLPHRRQD